MKKLLLPAFLLVSFYGNAQNHQLVKLWETDTILNIPESVLPDFAKNILYVSIIDGGGWDADGKGGIAKLSLSGKTIDLNFITGLNAPKGLGKFGNRLYAADIGKVAVIDINKRKVEKKIVIPDGSGLNDITVSDKGVVYVSDSKTSKIWKIENDEPFLFLENVKGANGVKAIGNDLIYAEGKDLKKADADKKVSLIATVTEGIDGIEPVGNGDFIVTSWVGYIYYVHSDGKVETLLETHDQKINAADIGYNPGKKIVYVPTFMHKTVAAYQLK